MGLAGLKSNENYPSSSDVSIVIRCKDDPHVIECIQSIDVEAEIVVAYSGKDEFCKRITDKGAKCVRVPEGNLSIASNVGFEHASHGNVIIVDSDTVFQPGSILRMKDALIVSPVVRASLVFESSSESLLCRIVSNARSVVNSLPLVYTPGIAVRREVTEKLGGFLFNPVVPYAVDADLDFRIKRTGMKVEFLTDVVVSHSSISLRHDIRAAFRIGRGCRQSLRYWRVHREFGKLTTSALIGVKFINLPRLFQTYGLLTLIYQLAWDFTYWCGFLSLPAYQIPSKGGFLSSD